jgi:hypothetical protein
VILPLGSEDKWQLYKSSASQSGLKGAEVRKNGTIACW